MQNLRRELPTGYTLYLAVVLLFVQVAVSSGYDGMLVRHDGIAPLAAALMASAFTADLLNRAKNLVQYDVVHISRK